MRRLRIKRAHQGQAGSITVEFALVTPIVLLVLLLFLETMHFYIATTLLERSLYDIAYQLRLAHGRNLPQLTKQVLEARGGFLLDPAAVKVQASSGKSISQLVNGGIPGAGEPGDLVRLTLTAKLGFLGAVSVTVPLAEQQRSVTLTLLQLNEPDTF